MTAYFPTSDICFRQGTWQFMAADLVESSSGILHRLHHDLESFFWVLMWIILTRVPTSWSDDARTSFVNQTMSPMVYSHSGGTGGTLKSSWLTSDRPLIEEKFQIPASPNLRELAEELLTTVSARYRVRPPRKPSSLNPFVLSGAAKTKTVEDERSEIERYEAGLTFLNDHNLMLRQFEAALEAKEKPKWPSDDKASPQRILPAGTPVCVSQTSSKRSRSVVEENDAFNTASTSKRKG